MALLYINLHKNKSWFIAKANCLKKRKVKHTSRHILLYSLQPNASLHFIVKFYFFLLFFFYSLLFLFCNFLSCSVTFSNLWQFQFSKKKTKKKNWRGKSIFFFLFCCFLLRFVSQDMKIPMYFKVNKSCVIYVYFFNIFSYYRSNRSLFLFLFRCLDFLFLFSIPFFFFFLPFSLKIICTRLSCP